MTALDIKVTAVGRECRGSVLLSGLGKGGTRGPPGRRPGGWEELLAVSFQVMSTQCSGFVCILLRSLGDSHTTGRRVRTVHGRKSDSVFFSALCCVENNRLLLPAGAVCVRMCASFTGAEGYLRAFLALRWSNRRHCYPPCVSGGRGELTGGDRGNCHCRSWPTRRPTFSLGAVAGTNPLCPRAAGAPGGQR